MKNYSASIITCLCLLLASCNSKTETATIKEEAATETVFPKGEKITNDNFTGNAWLYPMVAADSINKTSVGNVTFEPGARTKWHLHPNGQIILAMAGQGFYQEKGSAKRILRRGDVVTCPPNIPHWHGASTDQQFIQIAITSTLNGPVQWMEAVSEQEYLQ